jgi:hypothetical protein
VPPVAFGADVPSFSENGQLGPTDLSVASSDGLTVARGGGAFEGNYNDAYVELLAQAHIRMYPILGVPCPSDDRSCPDTWNPTPSAAAAEIGPIVAGLAQRYGPGGTFWSAHPSLPYMPVESFEIGNEPNLPTKWVVDATHMHWTDPSSYAQVYEAARTALHQVDPTGVAVVGGLADSAELGVDVTSDEQWLAALTSGDVDAVGYHAWVYDVSNALLETDTAELRAWMDEHGLTKVPIDVNEFGACNVTVQTSSGTCQRSQPSEVWGAAAAQYVGWAACTTWLGIENIQAFYWGDAPWTDGYVWLPLVASDGSLTPYGLDYLDEVASLTTTGCPESSAPAGTAPNNTSPPTIDGGATVGDRLVADHGTWSGDPAPTFTYRWLQCDAGSGACAEIPQATASTYLVQPDDAGSRVAIAVTAVNSVHFATVQSALTAVITSSPTSVGATSGGSSSGGSTSGPPPPSGAAVGARPRHRVASMDIQIVYLRRRGDMLTARVHYRARSGSVTAAARTRRGRKALLVRLRARRTAMTAMTFKATLRPGRWTVTFTGTPAHGYARPKAQGRRVVVPRRRAAVRHR